MESIPRPDLEQLFFQKGDACVSLYLPTHRAGLETIQDPIRLKNLLRKAECALRSAGTRVSDVRRLLTPARRLLNDYKFWQHQAHGLAIFTSRSISRLYRLPVTVPERVEVSGRFNLMPLLGCIGPRRHFYLLAISEKSVRLYRGNAEELVDIGAWTMASMSTRDAHSPTRHLSRCAVEPGDADTVALRDEMARVDRSVTELVNEDRAPVVVAASESLNQIYRQVTACGDLLDETIPGNPESRPAEKLHLKSRAIAEDYLAKNQAKAIDLYLRLCCTGRTSNTLAKVLPAAHRGRIEILFLPAGVQLWGRFDEVTSETVIFGEPTLDDQDLLNLAAIQTVIKGGTVYTVPPGEMPGAGNVAAVFRY